MTGHDPRHTGVYDFFHGRAGDYRMMRRRRCRRSDALGTPVAGWPHRWRPQRPRDLSATAQVNGFLVPGLLSPRSGQNHLAGPAFSHGTKRS